MGVSGVGVGTMKARYWSRFRIAQDDVEEPNPTLRSWILGVRSSFWLRGCMCRNQFTRKVVDAQEAVLLNAAISNAAMVLC